MGARGAAVMTAAASDVDFATQQRLDAARAGLVVEIRRDEHVAVVSDGHRGRAAPRGLIHEFRDFAGTVKKTVVSVKMKVNEMRLPHAGVF